MCTHLKCFVRIMSANAWDSDQLEIFDLVEEINENFYNILNISQDADLQMIKKAFRSQSLILHPDKNDAKDADMKFRNLVSVYEVLKDPNKRNHYNDVLKNGLPNWKSAVYYYRHVRKMGLSETLFTLFIVITIGQYLVAWSSYIEKKYTAEQLYSAKYKKQQKKKGIVVSTDEIPLELIEALDIRKPSVLNTLPVQIPCLLWATMKELGPRSKQFACWVLEQRNERAPQSSDDSQDEDQPPEPRNRGPRKRKPGFVPTERSDSELPPRIVHVSGAQQGAAPVVISGGLWTDDDLAELVLLVKKFPGGAANRWEKIAEAMNRTVEEVTYMAGKLKENFYRVPGQEESEKNDLEIPKKLKTKGGKLGPISEATTEPLKGEAKGNAFWSQLQQKSLEAALAKHPKGPTDRWERIAKCVPEKTKEECILRYKYLVEMLKKQKEKKDEGTEMPEEND